MRLYPIETFSFDGRSRWGWNISWKYFVNWTRTVQLISNSAINPKQCNFVFSQSKFVLTQCKFVLSQCKFVLSQCKFLLSQCKFVLSHFGGKENLHVKNKRTLAKLRRGTLGVLWTAILGGGGNREIPQHCCIYVHVDKHVDRNILHICIFIVHVDKISGLPMRHLFLEQASNHLQDMRWLHLTFHDYILIERIHHLYVLWWNTSL